MITTKLLNVIIKYKRKKGYHKNINYYNDNILIGGGKKRIIKLSDIISEEIIFEEIYIDDEKSLILYELENKKNNCILITIRKDKREAVIENLYVKDRRCINLTDFSLKNAGTFNLKIAIKVLRKYKEKFNINKIVLEDVATVECNNNEYPLSSLLLLTKGYSFYEKEGFIYSEKDFNLMLDKYKNYVKNIRLRDIKPVFKLLKNENNLKTFIKENKNNNILKILQIIFTKENMDNNLNICNLYPKINNELIGFYQQKLGNRYIDLFTTNRKMELII